MKLLVAALEVELVAFPAEIPGFDRLVTGPGKLKAGVRLADALTAASYDEIVVVGTGGGIALGLPDGVHEIVAAIQHDVRDLAGTEGAHVSLPQRIEVSGARGPGLVIATGDSFVDDEDSIARIRRLGGQIVDMETYAYAWVAQEKGVPLRVLKSLSDRAESTSAIDWDTTVVACSAELWETFSAQYLG